MNSDQIFDAIEEVAKAKGNAKQTVVAKYINDVQFEAMLFAALDPFTTYGVAKLTAVGVDGGRPFNDGTVNMLGDLATRKLSGNAALDAIHSEMMVLSEESAELLRRIIKKDLRAGFTTKTVNKVRKGTFKEFPYMRCSLTSKVDIAHTLDWERGVISQEKADGMFANVNHEIGGHVDVTSRQGSPFPLDQLQAFVFEVKTRIQPGTQTHGEFLVAVGGEVQPREISNGIMNRILKGGEFNDDESLIYQVWDNIPLESVKPKGCCKDSYASRLRGLSVNLGCTKGDIISVIPTRVVHSVAEAYEHYYEMLAAGKEGTVIKDPKGVWRDGTSKQQIKLKLDVDVDLVVIAVVPGRDGTKNEGRAGSLTCKTSCGGLVVDVTVKNEKMRDEIDANPEDWLDKVIVVRSNQILTPSKSNDNHSLFLPRMVETGYRADKDVADSLESVSDQFSAAMGLGVAA